MELVLPAEVEEDQVDITIAVHSPRPLVVEEVLEVVMADVPPVQVVLLMEELVVIPEGVEVPMVV